MPVSLNHHGLAGWSRVVAPASVTKGYSELTFYTRHTIQLSRFSVNNHTYDTNPHLGDKICT